MKLRIEGKRKYCASSKPPLGEEGREVDSLVAELAVAVLVSVKCAKKGLVEIGSLVGLVAREVD